MKNLFVYGTLMNKGVAAGKLLGCKYVGTYRLANYAMYKISWYPGIVPCEGESVVGEVYEIPDTLIPELDSYEGEGDLYLRKEVQVSRDEEIITAIVYQYNRSLEEVKINGGMIMREPWNADSDDYVWYACYGSNLDEERFQCYIKGGKYELTGRVHDGCRDKTHWIEDCMKRYKGRMYFANSSPSWDNKGVAFYDPSDECGYTHMKLYKITRGQFYDIQCQEGLSWYGKIICLDVLNDNCPVYTITNERVLEENMPCEKYISLIRNSLMKCLKQGEFEIDNYLAGCGEKMKKKIREKYRRNEKDAEKEPIREIRFSSEMYALNRPPVDPFRIIIENIVENGWKTVIVKEERYSFQNPSQLIETKIISENRWNDDCSYMD